MQLFFRLECELLQPDATIGFFSIPVSVSLYLTVLVLTAGLRDNSGLEIFYTRDLRPTEAGMVTAGHLTTSTQMIPPGQSHFTTGSVCSQQCTQKVSSNCKLMDTIGLV